LYFLAAPALQESASATSASLCKLERQATTQRPIYSNTCNQNVFGFMSTSFRDAWDDGMVGNSPPPLFITGKEIGNK